MRIDERGRERQPPRVDDAVIVGADSDSDLRDHTVVDAQVHHRVDALHRIEHARRAHDDVLGTGPADEHHATSTAVSTATGPVVSRS